MTKAKGGPELKAFHDSAEMLRICNRHKARTLTKLEEVNCPDGLLDIVRAGFGYLRSDLIETSTKHQPHGSMGNSKEVGFEGQR